MVNNIPNSHSRRWAHPHVLVILAVCALLFVTFIREQPHAGTPSSTRTPRESQQSALRSTSAFGPLAYEWEGKMYEPKYVSIPILGISGYVQAVGVTARNEIAVPSDVRVSGWYNKSVLPGNPGLSIIDGHVRSRAISRGIFYNLKNASIGDRIHIEFGDGSNKRFTVYSTKIVSTEDANSLLFTQDQASTAQLNLITCTGTYNESTQTYDKRVLVSARLE